MALKTPENEVKASRRESCKQEAISVDFPVVQEEPTPCGSQRDGIAGGRTRGRNLHEPAATPVVSKWC
jgi:hypothetical protein